MIDDQELVHRLLDAGVADKDTLRKGITLRNDSGGTLYEALVMNRLVSQRATVRLIGKLLAVPTIRLDAIKPSDRVTALIPASMARRNRSIPLGLREKEGKRHLLVAMFDPTDVLAVGELSTHTGFDVRPILVGPRDLAAAMEEIYGVKDTFGDDIFGDISDLDFGASKSEGSGPPDKEWSEFFDKRDEVGAQSSDISLEMRDRPSTDVLDIPEEEVDAILEEGDDSMDAFEIVETGRHNAVAMADLKQYQVDEAITGNTGVKDDTGNHNDSGSFAQILSANAAEALFTEPGDAPRESPDANVNEHVGGSGPYQAAELIPDSEAEEVDDDDESDEESGTSVGMRLDDLSDLADTNEAEPSSTSIGHGVRETLAENQDTNELDSDKIDNTGQTSFGVAPADESDAGTGAAVQGMAKGRSARGRGHRSNTDYRALGAQILKDESDAESDSEVDETSRTNAEEKALEDAQTGIRQRSANGVGSPDDDTNDDIDDDTNVRSPGTQRAQNPFAENKPTEVDVSSMADEGRFVLPDDIPTREMLEVVIESMLALGLADSEELIELARKRAARRRS